MNSPSTFKIPLLRMLNLHKYTLALCWLFVILYGVWLQPNTVFLRNVCLVGGAILSLPIIYVNRKAFFDRAAIPIWLIFLLLIWTSIHLFFIGLDFSLQEQEYMKAWKKIAISIVFALGLGLSIKTQMFDVPKSSQYWQIVYFGLTLPLLIYFIKLTLTNWALNNDVHLSPLLLHSREIFTDPFAIHRSGYVFFILPAMSIAFFRLSRSIMQGKFFVMQGIPFILIITATFLVFYIENDRLGFVFGFLILLVSAAPIYIGAIKNLSLNKFILLVFIAAVAATILGISYKQNNQWQTLIADSKIAIQVDKYDAWKYDRQTRPNLPINEFGKPASLSNYERIAWATVGFRLLEQHPLGYGLMSQSFGHLCRLHWPDAQTSWSHSAWLDFALGYGFPGVGLILIAALLVWVNRKKTPQPWDILGGWVIGIWILLLFTKELSAEIYINTFIFILIWAATLNLRPTTSLQHAVTQKDV